MNRLRQPTLSPTGSPTPPATLVQEPRVVLVGNPNVGKSVIFGFLTGRYVTVSNYPGTTVTLTRGKADLDGRTTEIIDTPGINSLIPMSEDERVTRDIVFQQPEQSIIQVADARNLRRALLITTQLAEMGVSFSLDLNMTDEASSVGVKIDRGKLADILGVPVAQTVAVRRKGFPGLRQAVRDQQSSDLRVSYPEPIEAAIAAMEPHLPQTHISKCTLALTLLAGDDTLLPWLRDRVGAGDLEAIQDIRRRAVMQGGGHLNAVINRSRLRTVDRIVKQVETRPSQKAGTLLDTLGNLAMHPVWGVPILLMVLWAMYQLVGVLGAGTMVDFLESQVFGKYLSPWAIQASDFLFRFPHQHLVEEGLTLPDYGLSGDLSTWGRVMQFVHDLLVGPYGQITMALSYAIALILPIVATFFIAFGLLEDSGYLPRLAVMLNRIFRTMGLNGKAVLPMVLGLGCDTMATLTTRILETKKERIIVTLLLALGVPCSAQLGVILGMISALSLAATTVWLGSVAATLFAVGWLAARVVPGQSSDFSLEVPPIRRPQFGNIVVKTLARIEWYLREAVPLFLLGTFVLFALDALQLLAVVERAAAPVVQGILGLPTESAEAFLIGFLRRDYGAAGLYELAREGRLDSVQIIVAMVTITLFVPCIANFFIMIKERGVRTALAMVAFIVPMAFLVGGVLNWGLRALGVTF